MVQYELKQMPLLVSIIIEGLKDADNTEEYLILRFRKRFLL